DQLRQRALETAELIKRVIEDLTRSISLHPGPRDLVPDQHPLYVIGQGVPVVFPAVAPARCPKARNGVPAYRRRDEVRPELSIHAVQNIGPRYPYADSEPPIHRRNIKIEGILEIEIEQRIIFACHQFRKSTDRDGRIA